MDAFYARSASKTMPSELSRTESGGVSATMADPKNGRVCTLQTHGLHANVPEYMVQGATTYRLITDQVGSVRLLMNTATGAVAERIDYDEFGNVLADSAPGFQPFGFAGGLRDGDTALTRFGARDYDPITGRWTAKDPLRFGGGLDNLYSYVDSDAINELDPSGRIWLKVAGAGVGAFTGFLGSIGGQAVAYSASNHGSLSGFQVNWGEAGVAAAWGGGTGFLAPWAAATTRSAALFGGLANLSQYYFRHDACQRTISGAA